MSDIADYKALHSQLQAELNTTLTESQSLLDDFSELKTQHNSMTAKISLLLNILEKVVGPLDERIPDLTTKKKPRSATKPPSVFTKLSKTHPHLQPLISILKSTTLEPPSSSLAFTQLKQLRMALQTENDLHYTHLKPHLNISRHTNQNNMAQLQWLNDAIGLTTEEESKLIHLKNKTTGSGNNGGSKVAKIDKNKNKNVSKVTKGKGRGGNRKSCGAAAVEKVENS